MTPIIKYRILIVDDNPFPTRECCGILLEKLQNHFGKSFDHTLQEYYCNDYNALQTQYHEIAGKSFHFIMDDDVSISIYNYNPTDTKENNQTKILKIIKDKEINIFWTDRGYSQFKLDSGSIYEENNKYNTNSDHIFKNSYITSQLKENGVIQVAVYSYNPKLAEIEIDIRRKEIHASFGTAIKEEDIYVLETSPILNLFNEEDYLSAGEEENFFLGTLKAYEQYGKLLGSVLFDLFLQLKENKAKLSERQRRYNFFNRYNRNFLRYFKLVNSDLVNKTSGFKVGMVSFYGNIYGQEHFLIDVPYKEYYEKYDNELHKGNPAIGTILNPIDSDEPLNSKKWLHFKYKKDSDGQFIGCYELEESIKSRDHLVEGYLPLLHTGIFYEPDFYTNGNFPFERFQITTKDDFCIDAGNSCVEVIYLFKKVNFEGIQGVSHFVVWRRVEFDSEKIDLTDTIQEIWKNFYGLVEPKLEAALVAILQNESVNQATRAAISQVMARNMSHNIGSHVLSKFKDEKEICDVYVAGNQGTQFTGEDNFYAGSDYLQKGSHLIAYFNEYLKNRMDFLADIATTDPVMETPMYLFRDILKGFDKNRILLNRISGVSIDRKFKIIVPDKNGGTINNLNHSDDPLLAIPNEILGAQAFYILLENIIRNIYKHGNPTKDIEINIDVKDYEKDASFYEISIYDNIVKGNIDDAVTNRNTSFNDSVLKNKKALRPNNLGTIEMDVCAAYLRCLPIISIENSDFDLQEDNRTDIPRLIYAYKHKLSDTEFSLGYKLCISKPKEILVVKDGINKFSIKDCINEKELAKTGIKVIAKDELDKSEAIYNHQILYSLVSGDDLNTILEKKQAMLPKRVVYSSNHISLESSEKFIESVWEQYALKFFNESSKCYCIKNSESLKKHINFTSNGIELLSECNTTDCHTSYIDNHNQEWANKDNWNYYDMACSHSKINKLKDVILWDDNKKLTAEYIEVINTKVVLLDERIQQNISNEDRKYTANGIDTPLTEYFAKQKLFIPKQSDCDLNEVSFGTLAKSGCENGNTISSHICRYIKAHLTGIEKPDFVIIHLGILEKMLPSGKDKEQNDINDLINRLFNEERKRLVVTSGRGKPNNLPDDIPFVPLALVQNALETLFDKFLLTKILFNSRKSV